MIPKIIHYCWFGGNTKSELFNKCYRSWKKYCPDYKIIEWNESNFNIFSCPLYVQEAYQEKKWAFVTDYVRLKVVYDYGGIYLDTDVELKKSIDNLLHYDAYFGFEEGKFINTGLGFGSVSQLPLLKELMDDYTNISFILNDGSYDLTTCPNRNTKVFLKHNLLQNDKMQIIDRNIKIFPTIYFCPINYHTGKFKKSFKTISIHWFSASWLTEEQKIIQDNYLLQLRKNKAKEKKDYLLHIPNKILNKIIGDHIYEKLKKFLKK